MRKKISFYVQKRVEDASSFYVLVRVRPKRQCNLINFLPFASNNGMAPRSRKYHSIHYFTRD